jgi:hypothetical protein
MRFKFVGTGHFGEQRNNQGRQLEKGPEKDCAPNNREKKCEEARHRSTVRRKLESGKT